ncbi:MAG: hypothetical protein QMD85_04890, partial [Candidatus Aenigmarchaeota archaeon]|nr:hypothetical protein [Candidatus Aenigmarchaeota archaeon]MDI6722899.1 hypothetical protein [Candidatus Aenigmarchaeota archaeon]
MPNRVLNGNVFFEIQKPDLKTEDYRHWIEYKVLKKWLAEKEGNREYEHMGTGEWNRESGIGGYFGGEFFASCKLYKFDGTCGDWWGKQGVLIRDHYSPSAAEKVKRISDRFE